MVGAAIFACNYSLSNCTGRARDLVDWKWPSPLGAYRVDCCGVLLSGMAADRIADGIGL